MTTVQRDRPTSSRATSLVIGAVLVLAGLIALTGVFGNREQATLRFEGVSELDLDLRSAAVTIRAGDGDDIVVEKDVTTGFFGGSSNEEQNGSTLRLTKSCPAVFGFRCGGNYVITVPTEVEIRGNTTNGNIRLEAIQGPIDVTTTNGEVDLEEVKGSTTVETSNGRIRGTALGVPSLRLSTSNGTVFAEFAASPTTVEIRTSNGDVEVVVPNDTPPLAVSTDTSNGSMSIQVRTDPSAEASLPLSPPHGDTVVRYP